MTRRILLAFTLLLIATGCADNVLKERPIRRVAATPSTAKPALSVTTSRESSVCAAYRRQLRYVRLSLLAPAAKGREAMKQRELNLQAVIADACE